MANPAIIDSYTTLKNAIEDYLNRSDIDDEGVSEMVIDLAEARLNADLVHPKRSTRDDAFTIDSQYENVPTGFWSVRRFSLDTSPPCTLEYLTPEEMDERRERYSASGEPRWYTVIGTTFEFLPTPGATYTGKLVYTAAIPALASNATNWALDDFPHLYLAASLAEAHAWQQDEAEEAKWLMKYQTALQAVHKSGQREAYGGTPRAKHRSFG